MLAKLTLGLYKYTDVYQWAAFTHTKLGLTLVSLILGGLASLGYAPYQLWIVTLTTLGFEFFYISTLKTKKAVFCSLLLYFTALNTITLEWLNFVMTDFGQLPVVVSYLIETLFSAYLAIFHALFGMFAFRLAMRKLKGNELKAHLEYQKQCAEYDAKASALAEALAKAQANLASDNTDNKKDTESNSKQSADKSADKSVNNSNDDDWDEDDEGEVEMAPRGFAASATSPSSNNEAQESTEKNKESAAATPRMHMRSAPVGGHAQGMSAGAERLYPVFKLKDGQEHRFFKNAFLLCFLPIALVLADFVISVLFSGFPWMLVGYTTLTGPFSAFAPLIGVRGITLLLFISAGAIALAIERRYIYLPIAGMIFLAGIMTLGIKYVTPLEPITVAAIQGNIPQAIKWDPRMTIPSIDKYINLTTDQFGKNDLIVWPESAMPVYVQQVIPLIHNLNNYAYESKTPLLIGIQRITPKKESYNSMFLFGQESNYRLAQVYDKRQLVPFGEVVPFEKYTRQLGSIFNFPMSGFTAGGYYQKQIHLKDKDLYFIPALCYESIFPELMRSMHDKNTNGIIMISNDSWYGDTRGPQEHLAIAQMRSLEMQKPMIRVTNSGITAHISDMGEIVNRLPSNVDGVLQMSFVPTKGATPFARFGNWPLFALMILVIALGVYLRAQEQDALSQELADLVRP